MINLTRLYFGQPSVEKWTGGFRRSRSRLFGSPLIVWSPTRRCNYSCARCLSGSEDQVFAGELSTRDALGLLDGLGEAGVTHLRLWGGEPLARPDLDILIRRAVELGIRVGVDSNGALLTPERAQALREAGAASVSVRLEGRKALHDARRGVPGAFEAALHGIRAAKKAGLEVAIRFGLDPDSAQELNWVFEVADREGVQRIRFCHPVYGGRGWSPEGPRLSPEETRVLLIQILHKARELLSRGRSIEVLTDNQPADGPYLMLKLAKNHPDRAGEIGDWLCEHGPARAGVEMAYIDPAGNVHPDPYWRSPLGNAVREPFSRIWEDGNNRVLQFLRDGSVFLKGRCAACAFLRECGGGLRSRALALRGDPMDEDPECYLSDEEIRWGLVGA